MSSENDFIGPPLDSDAQRKWEELERHVLENFQSNKETKSDSKESHIHTRLPVEVLNVLQGMRVRLAGWGNSGNFSKTQLRKDFTTFRALEDEETQWVRDLKNPENNKGEKGEDGLTQEQRDALSHFQAHGGHAGKLSLDQLNYICQNGLILLLELEVRKNLYATVGSISSLQETPFTRKGALYKATPNFDIRDSGLHKREREEEHERADKRIVIWRTTIRESLESALCKISLPEELEGTSLRRMGLGATLKDVLFHFAQQCEKEWLTFNIGTLYNSADSELNKRRKLASNIPSEKHNDWVEEWSGVVRPNYDDHILHTNTADVYMLWKAYTGYINDGLDEFEKEGGLLRGKGILDVVDLKQQADLVYQQIEWEKEHKIHGRNKKSWTVKEC